MTLRKKKAATTPPAMPTVVESLESLHISKNAYDSKLYYAIPKYSVTEAKKLALSRTREELSSLYKNKGENKQTTEYKEYFKAFAKFFYEEISAEVELVKKSKADHAAVKAAHELPSDILSLIDKKLPRQDSVYFIRRFIEFSIWNKEAVKNPMLRFQLSQAILEEINISKKRDLYILSPNNNDLPDMALAKAVDRYMKLMPKEMNTPSTSTPAEDEIFTSNVANPNRTQME